jgi:hypothetical protein
MFSCDYNGWADVPEEEREAIDAFEAANLKRFTPTLAMVIAKQRAPSVGARR